MKNILITTLEFPPRVGGIASYVRQMARALPPENTTVYAPPSSDAPIHDEGETYTIIRNNPLFPFFIWPRWMRATRHFLSIVREKEIDCMFVNHVLPLGYAAYITKKLRGTPYLIFSHGTDMVYATRNRWKRMLLSRVLNDAEQIIFNSESLRRRFLERMPDYAAKSLVLYPCPDQSFFEAVPEARRVSLRRTLALEGKKVILSVGRLEEGKGFPHVLRVFKTVLEKEPHAVLIIIGDGAKRAQIHEQIEKQSLQNAVRYLGEIVHADIPVYYQLADVFMLLTHPDNGLEEGLGLVFLEAAASKLPVIAGKSGGVEEAVEHGVTGMVFDVHHEYTKIADALIQLLADEQLRTHLGTRGRERMLRMFTLERQLKTLDPWIAE